MKQFFVSLTLTLLFCNVWANGALRADSLHRFRFVSGRGMFYVPYKENDEELERLLTLIRTHRDDILSGNVPVFVEGFCTDRTLARERSNRVKSEMIVRGGLREECFRTTNHAAAGDYVEVRIALPAEPAPSAESAAPDATEKVQPAETLPYAAATDKAGADAARTDAGTDTPSAPTEQPLPSSFSLRTNLLRLATLTADLGVEYRFADARVGILVNGTYADWGWKDKQRRYKIWRISPEVRCYLGRDRRGFLGAMYHQGEFNYKLSTTGKTGDYRGGGITGGYRLPLDSHFAFDFHAALGYTRAEYDKYTRIGGVNVRDNKDGRLVKNYWGVNQLGISLLYDF